MADPIRLGNFFSTFDTESVISQLTTLRQAPIRKLAEQKALLQQQKSTLSGLSANFSALLLRAKLLADSTSVSGKSATVEGAGVSAAASPGSSPGTFTVSVASVATGTTTRSAAISAAFNASAPLDTSNLAVPVVPGTFTVKTTTGGQATIKVGAAAADAASPLSTANVRTAVTAGTFTLSTATGGPVVVTVNPATQSLDDVVAAINAAGAAAGLSASITNDANGRPNQLTLTSTQGNITTGAVADTSNFLSAMNLASGGASVTSTAAFTVQQSLNQVLADINASGIGVTATLGNDANGKANIVQLTSTQGAITLGLGSDTSNFLSATNLLASPGTTSRASTLGIARLNSAHKMANASFDGGPPAAGDHSLSINGVTIPYNVASDSLNDLIGRINASAAGVAARYDSVTDTIKLTQTRTGSTAIALADDGAGGDLLSKLGLLNATQTVGTNAEYSIDGGPSQFSESNTVTVSGTTLTLAAPTTTPAKVTVVQDATTSLTNVKNFVAEFNGLMDAIGAATKHSATAGNDGALSADTSLLAIQSQLRSIVTGLGTNPSGNFSSVGQVGLSFGAIGSAVGSTNKLVLDETRFKDALAKDPTSVQSLFSEFQLAAALTPGGTGSLTGVSGTYGGTTAGSYVVTDDGAGNLTAVFTPADGGPDLTTTGTIGANGTNTTLIPGLTLSAGALTAGSNTISVTPARQSVVARMRGFLEVQSGAGGVLTKRLETYDKRVSDIDKRSDQIQAGIDKEMDRLRAKFRAMEQAQARAQSIMQQLQAQMAKSSNSN